MIAKGNPHNDGPYLARYLAASSKGNETAELAELRGFAADNLFDAFALGQLLAEGTRCEKPFFHVQVRTPHGEELTREQWARAAAKIEHQLGFDGQPRAVVFHQKDGHRHMHLVWSRIDAETMHAIDPGLYKLKLKEACRKLEKEFGLRQVRNARDPAEKTQPAARPEFEQSRRLKTELKTIREDIRACWDRSADGKAFAAALDEKGLILARGDRRSFVVVDEMGGYHALGKRITGATAKETLARLDGVAVAALPSVDEAKAAQEARHTRKGEAMSEQQHETARLEEEQRREAVEKEEAQRQELLAKEEERRQATLAEEEQRREEGNREEEKQREAFKAQVDRQVEQAREMEAEARRIEALKANMAREIAAQEQRLVAYQTALERQAETARQEEERRRQAAIARQASEWAIRNPYSRYGQALAQHYDTKDPYGSLARSAMAEYGAFLRDREKLDEQIARADDPKEREALELRKRIEAAEYMEITSERIATQSEIIVGRSNTEEAQRQRARAAEFRTEAKELRGQLKALREPQQQEREDRAEAPEKEQAPGPCSQVAPEQRQQEDRARTVHEAPRREEAQAKQPAVLVEERKKGQVRGEPQGLEAFVKGLPEEKQQPMRPLSQAELRKNPAARKAHYAQLMAEQERGPALDRMGEDLRVGRPVSADDVRKLGQADREKIKEKGENHLREMVQQREQERSQIRER